jgi:hypothetical protein
MTCRPGGLVLRFVGKPVRPGTAHLRGAVAQPGRAAAWHADDRGFKSRWLHAERQQGEISGAALWLTCRLTSHWAASSSGRALPSQGRGVRFNSGVVHGVFGSCTRSGASGNPCSVPRPDSKQLPPLTCLVSRPVARPRGQEQRRIRGLPAFPCPDPGSSRASDVSRETVDRRSGCSAARLARIVRGDEVRGSNPRIPTSDNGPWPSGYGACLGGRRTPVRVRPARRRQRSVVKWHNGGFGTRRRAFDSCHSDRDRGVLPPARLRRWGPPG